MTQNKNKNKGRVKHKYETNNIAFDGVEQTKETKQNITMNEQIYLDGEWIDNTKEKFTKHIEHRLKHNIHI